VEKAAKIICILALIKQTSPAQKQGLLMEASFDFSLYTNTFTQAMLPCACRLIDIP
jgi:hypothetical protein